MRDTPHHPAEPVEDELKPSNSGELDELDNILLFDLLLKIRKDKTDLYGFSESKAAIADAKAALLAWRDREKTLAEAYGHLHESIELFQKGWLTADQYTERNSKYSDQISALHRGTEPQA